MTATARPLLVVTRPVAIDALEQLRGRCEVRVLEGDAAQPIPSADELIAGVRDAELLFTLPAHPVTAQVIASAPQLRVIATMGTGYDNIDLAAARGRAIPVTNAPGILDETTADLVLALLLAAARRLPEAERALRAGSFRGWSPDAFLGQDIYGKTLGIIGMGRIGLAVGRRARGFGMGLVYTSPRRSERAESELAARPLPLDELLRTADFVSLHCPLNPSTRHLIDAAALAKMKRTAVLINTARGPVVDEGALATALAERRIAAAALDVYEREPNVHPDLLRLENVVLAPHIGSASEATRTRMALRAAENVLAFLDGRPLLNPV